MPLGSDSWELGFRISDSIAGSGPFVNLEFRHPICEWISGLPSSPCGNSSGRIGIERECSQSMIDVETVTKEYSMILAGSICSPRCIVSLDGRPGEISACRPQWSGQDRLACGSCAPSLRPPGDRHRHALTGTTSLPSPRWPDIRSLRPDTGPCTPPDGGMGNGRVLRPSLSG